MRNAPAHTQAAPASCGVKRCVPFMFNLTPFDARYTGGHRRFGAIYDSVYSYRYL